MKTTVKEMRKLLFISPRLCFYKSQKSFVNSQYRDVAVCVTQPFCNKSFKECGVPFFGKNKVKNIKSSPSTSLRRSDAHPSPAFPLVDLCPLGLTKDCLVPAASQQVLPGGHY